jgi:hypothetical protein
LRDGPPVAAGVLLFLNELHPTLTDIETWRRETQEGVTDIVHNPEWKSAELIPEDKKIERMIHVTAVTPESRQRALSEFDNVVRKIEICRGEEANGKNLFEAWPGNSEDKATCDACDANTFCPSLKGKTSSKSTPIF